MFIIYHNPKCKHSRAGLQYLQNKGVEFKVRDYIKEGITETELKEILIKLNKSPIDVIRKQEEIYKKELKGRVLSDNEWIEIIIENPKLLHRPIVVSENKAILAQPPELIDEIL